MDTPSIQCYGKPNYFCNHNEKSGKVVTEKNMKDGFTFGLSLKEVNVPEKQSLPSPSEILCSNNLQDTDNTMIWNKIVHGDSAFSYANVCFFGYHPNHAYLCTVMNDRRDKWTILKHLELTRIQLKQCR